MKRTPSPHLYSMALIFAASLAFVGCGGGFTPTSSGIADTGGISSGNGDQDPGEGPGQDSQVPPPNTPNPSDSPENQEPQDPPTPPTFSLEQTRDSEWSVSSPNSNTDFGFAVAVDQGWALVGAPGISHPSSKGAVYVYQYAQEAWKLAQILGPAGNDTSDDFGFGVDIQENTLIVGATYGENANHLTTGKAWIYEREGGSWNLKAELIPQDATSFGFFGARVVLGNHGQTAFVGAFDQKTSVKVDGVNQLCSGAVYVYEKTNGSWAQTAKLLPDPQTFYKIVNQSFGTSLSVSEDGNRVAVAAYADDDGVDEGVGAVYLFEKQADQWQKVVKIFPNKLLGYDKEEDTILFEVVALSPAGDKLYATGYHTLLGFEIEDAPWSALLSETVLASSDSQENPQQLRSNLLGMGFTSAALGQELAVFGAHTDGILNWDYPYGGNLWVYRFDEDQDAYQLLGSIEPKQGGQALDGYGFSVDLSKEWMAVGARDSGGLGKFYLYRLK